MDSVMSWLFDVLTSGHHSELLLRALDPSKRIALPAILSAVLIAYAVYAIRVRPERKSGASFWRFLFPREIYRSHSARVDLQIALATVLLKPVQFIVMGVTVALFAANLTDIIIDLFGPPPALLPNTWGVTLLLGLVAFLLTDFSTYLVHRLSHERRFLWAFHRVHHSAEVLTPLTVERKHPLFGVAARVLDLALVSPFYALVLYFWPTETDAMVILVVRWTYGLFALAGANLRHSHVWVSFGPFWERILISPAQHQIHHSRAAEHWDVNYGEVLAIWDWALGTLRLSEPQRQHLDFGLAGELEQPHSGFLRAMGEPFVYAWGVLRTTLTADSRSSDDAGRPLHG